MGVTQKQIAVYLGISNQTVSDILNDKGHLYRDETRRRVETAAAQMGYRRSGSAVAMRRGRTDNFTLLLSSDPSGRSVLSESMLRGILSALGRHNMHLTVEAAPDEDLTAEGFVPKLLREIMSDGLLINYSAKIPQQMIELISRLNVPAVWLNSKQKADCVYPDEFQGASRAARELVAHGHRRIAFVDFAHRLNEDSWHYSNIDRFDGYASVMKEIGQSAQCVGSHEEMVQGLGLERLTALLQSPNRPTAILAYRPHEANMAVVAAALSGLRVPRDLSLVTFCTTVSQEMGVPLATVHIPESLMGQEGVEMLRRRIEQQGQPQPPLALAMEFSEGQSIAACPTGAD